MATCKSKSRRENSKCMAEEAVAPPLPLELVLEIVARTDARALIRCAATSKLLRRDILSPSFVRRVSQKGGILPQCILAYLDTTHEENKQADTTMPPLSLVHPSTTAAAQFLDDQMSPHMARFADDLLREHVPVASRGGLVLFRRRRHASSMIPNLCVYDLYTGHRTFLSDPPDIVGLNSTQRHYVLLTAADGINCSFLLFVANLSDGMPDNNDDIHTTIQVQTATSACHSWAPATMIHESNGFLRHEMQQEQQDAVVLHGGVIHWLVRCRGEIVTCNVYTMEQGTIQVPAVLGTNFNGRIGSYYSHDGRKLLRLVAIVKGFKLSVWHQLLGGDWAPEAVMIGMKMKPHLLGVGIKTRQVGGIKFKWLGERSNTVVLRICCSDLGINNCAVFIVLDLETKEMHVHVRRMSTLSSSVLLEVDPPARLRAMKCYP